MAKDKLKFYKKSHKYKVGSVELTSVTRFIHGFFKPFDAKEIARKLAKFKANRDAKRGVRYWLAQWKQDSEHGTRVHNALEDYIVTKTTDGLELPEERDINKFTNGFSFLENLTDFKLLEPEVKMFDEELGLAGTIDLLITNTDDTVSLVDWKTNKAIKNKSFSGNEKGKVPLQDLNDCNLVHYSLQLSTYAYMLERSGKVIKTLTLVHLQEDKYKEYNIDYEEYKPFVIKMLEAKNE